MKTNSIYTTSLRTSPSEQYDYQNQNEQPSQTQTSQSYQDLLFNHIMNIQTLQTDKENRSMLGKEQKRTNKYSHIAQKMILSQITPNFGTLADFMSEKSENRVIYTSKKYFFPIRRKRHEQSSQENAIKKKIIEKNNQEAILRSQQTSTYQKKIASKVFVQRIFNQVFNTPVEQFVSKNSIKAPKKSQMLNLTTLETLLSSNFVSTKDVYQRLKKIDTKQSDYSVKNSNEKNKGRVVHISYDPQTKLKKINELKSFYFDLRKISIPEQNTDFEILIQAQNKLDKYLKQLSQTIDFTQKNSILLNTARTSLINGKAIMLSPPVNVEKQMLEVSEKFRSSKKKSVIFSDTIAKVTHEEVVFRKMEFKDLDMGLYMINFVHLERIKVIRLENIKIEPSILFLFLDVLSKFAPQINPLKEVSICSISIQNTVKFSEKISSLLKQLNVKKLCLNYTDIGSKEFTKICVGMSQNECLQEVELKNNRIDYLSVKPLESLLRICHSLKTIDLRNNEIASYPNLKAKDDRIIV